MNAKGLLCSSAFMMSLAVVVSLITNASGLFPGGAGEVLNSDTRSNLTVFFLAVMMTISFSRYSYRDLNPLKNPRSVGRAVILGLVVASAIPLVGFFLLKDTEYYSYVAGLVFIAATPFAASVPALSYILRGDMEHALRSTIVVYILSLLWIPFIIWLCIGDLVDMGSVVLTVVEIIGVPLVVSRLLTKVEIDKDTMAVILNVIIFFLVWLSVSSANFSIGALILFAFLMVAFLRTFVLGNVVEAAEKRMGIHWKQRVTDILMTSYKNKGIALAMCAAALPGYMVPDAMVAIAASIIVEVCWVALMDGVLFSKKRMVRELAAEGEDVSGMM